MNITITQDNSRVEVLGSNGASIIKKLYELAIDPNNTLTLRGNISTTSAYEDQVDYLNTTYGPDLIVNATTKYMRFEDANAERVCAQYFGDGVGCTKSQLQSAYSTWRNGINGVMFVDALANAGVKKFNEFQYVQGISELDYGFFGNNTFDEITLPTGSIRITGTIFNNNNASTTIHNATSISYMAEHGSLCFKRGYILDFNKYTGRFENNGYSRSEIALCGNPYIIIPHAGRFQYADSNNKFQLNEFYYTSSVIFREDFSAGSLEINGRGPNDYDIPNNSSITKAVFLSTSVPYTSIDLNYGPNDIYVPSQSISTYQATFDQWRTVHSLEDFANISDDNKAILVEAGCTATGSTGNWTITPPTT